VWSGFTAGKVVVFDPVLADLQVGLGRRRRLAQQQQNSGDYEADSLEEHQNPLLARILQKQGII
jgi:hypothetical protein